MLKKHKQTGFTIVELLIVIVVIGILAAITIVAYNGVQARAKLAKKESEIGTIKKKMTAYRTLHDTFPLTAESAIADTDLGSGIATNTVPSSHWYNCSDPVPTKQNYCIAISPSTEYPGDMYAIYWWDDVKRSWMAYREDLDGDIRDEYGGPREDYPQWPNG